MSTTIEKESPYVHKQSRELGAYKREAIKAAKELFYGDDVVAEIQKATSVWGVDAVLGRARGNMRRTPPIIETKAPCKLGGKKLNDEKVAKIREYYAENRETRGVIAHLAKEYNVDRNTIYRVINNIHYK